jgi:hypothetical protein
MVTLILNVTFDELFMLTVMGSYAISSAIFNSEADCFGGVFVLSPYAVLDHFIFKTSDVRLSNFLEYCD